MFLDKNIGIFLFTNILKDTQFAKQGGDDLRELYHLKQCRRTIGMVVLKVDCIQQRLFKIPLFQVAPIRKIIQQFFFCLAGI